MPVFGSTGTYLGVLGVYGAVFSISSAPVGFVSGGRGDFISLAIGGMLPFFLCSSSEILIIVAGEPQSGQKRGLSVGKPSKLKSLLHKLQNIGTQQQGSMSYFNYLHKPLILKSKAEN